MKFRKVIALFMAAAVLGSVGLTGCSSQGGGQSSQENSSTGSGDLLAQIQERGEIVIAMEGTWAPWTYHDENDELVGFDVEVGQQIAEALGVEATFVEGEWDGLLAGLDAGRYDIMINGVDVTECFVKVFQLDHLSHPPSRTACQALRCILDERFPFLFRGT